MDEQILHLVMPSGRELNSAAEQILRLIVVKFVEKLMYRTDATLCS